MTLSDVTAVVIVPGAVIAGPQDLADGLRSAQPFAIELLVVLTAPDRAGLSVVAERHGARVLHAGGSPSSADLHRLAVAACNTRWALWLKPGDRVRGEPLLLSQRLRRIDGPLGHRVVVEQRVPTGGELLHAEPALTLTDALSWHGEISARPLVAPGTSPAAPTLVDQVLQLRRHTPDPGDPAAVARLHCWAAELGQRVHEFGSSAEAGAALRAVARAWLLAEQPELALAAARAASKLPSQPGPASNSLLLQGLLAAPSSSAHTWEAERALVRLRATGTDPAWCDWLAARWALRLGRAQDAWTLLDGVDQLQDPDGVRLDMGAVHEARSAAAELMGSTGAAADELLAAMQLYARVAGRGTHLLELWRAAGRDPSDLPAGLLPVAGQSVRSRSADQPADGRSAGSRRALFGRARP